MIELEQDRGEVRETSIVISAIVVFFVIGFSVLVVYVFTRAWRGQVRLRADDTHWWRSVPEGLSGIELRDFQEETTSERALQDARRHLAAYGWTDRKAALIHVPIDVAMDLYLAEQDTR